MMLELRHSLILRILKQILKMPICGSDSDDKKKDISKGVSLTGLKYIRLLKPASLISQSTFSIKDYSFDIFPVFIYISTPVTSNYRYLKVKLLISPK